MMTVENYLEPILKKYFQKYALFSINNEELKSGIFLLYNLSIYANNYFIEFHIKRDKKIDLLKIPYPFSTEEYEDDGLIYFDYRVKTLCKNNQQLVSKIEKTASELISHADNKFYNKILEIHFK